jgi:hypothetical protein
MSNEDILLQSLERFYSEYENYETFKKITMDANISLRIIDWFVTNYSKKYDICFNIYETIDGHKTLEETDHIYKNINVFFSYKGELKSFSKKKFDPFCRRDRIQFKDNSTTVGQLNFFRWAIDNLIVAYILEHYNLIESDMNDSIKLSKVKLTNKQQRKKRQELSQSASKSLNKHSMKIKIRFD